MDSIVMIMFGSVLCTMTALNFMELRQDSEETGKQAALTSTDRIEQRFNATGRAMVGDRALVASLLSIR